MKGVDSLKSDSRPFLWYVYLLIVFTSCAILAIIAYSSSSSQYKTTAERNRAEQAGATQAALRPTQTAKAEATNAAAEEAGIEIPKQQQQIPGYISVGAVQNRPTKIQILLGFFSDGMIPGAEATYNASR